MSYKIYTSYFGNLRKLKENDIVPISIALWRPRFYCGAMIPELAPTKFMLSDECSMELYVKMYKEKLAHIYSGSIIKRIEEIGKGKDVALLCYEKPGDFCHRHMFAEWFTKTTGIHVDEFVAPVVDKKQYAECSLF